jgi:hypothetical protein
MVRKMGCKICRALANCAKASAMIVILPLVCSAANSKWVRVGGSDRLLYTMDDRGDRIMDFSTVGYKGGIVPLPDYAALGVPINTVTPIAGDNLAHLQTAINQTAALPLNSNGFRGVVQLTAGTYNLSAGLSINTSGIIFRGVGDGASAASNTILSYTGTSQINLIQVDSPATRQTVANTTHSVIDKVVPVGATSFTVDSTTNWNVGDAILITRPSPQEWINAIGMNQLAEPWQPGSKNQSYERKITYIDQAQRRVFFDAPLVNSLESQYGGATVSRHSFNRTTNVGIESLRGNGQAVLTTPTDENHGYSFVVMQDTADSWVRNITGQRLVYATVAVESLSRNITVDDAVSIEPISQITGSRRYPFYMNGQFTLMKNLSSDEGRHDFVNGSSSRGPSVFLDAVSTDSHNDSGPHHRWSTGTLYDNVTVNGDNLNVQNRWNSGTGHGWAGANYVIWNSKAGNFYVQNPPGAQNWIVGSTGTVRSTSQYTSGSYPSYADANNVGSKVTLGSETSLYRAQLTERMSRLDELRLEYWAGDFDGYTNDGASDQPAVDPAWLAAVQAIKLPSEQIVGFDTPLSTGNILVPITLNFDVPGLVTSAVLTLAVHGVGSQAANDQIWIENLSGPIAFSQLGTLPQFGSSDIVMLEFLSSSTTATLDFLQDGQLNLLVSANHVVDWVDLQFTVVPIPGDFDADGDVDGADFTVWQTNFPKGSGATLAQGDADGDGDVDGADFVVWQTNFPFAPGSGAAPVPEPAAGFVAAVFWGLMVLGRKKFWRPRRFPC